jgi:hypothetical protein
LSLLIIKEAVCTHFYDVDMGLLIDSIHKNLYSSELLLSLPYKVSIDLDQLVISKSFQLLKSKFYNYYFTRTPVLVNMTRLVHKWLPPATDRRRFYQRKLESANIFFDKNLPCYHTPFLVLLSRNLSSSFFKYHTCLAYAEPLNAQGQGKAVRWYGSVNRQ